MATNAAQESGTSALTSQIEAIEGEFQALLKATVKGRRTRLIMFLVVLAFICVVAAVFYHLVQEVKSQENIDKIVSLARERLGGTTGILRSEGQRLIQHVRPVVADAAKTQFDQDLPKFKEALDRERKALVENLQARLQKEITVHQDEILEKYIGILAEEFPEAADAKLHDRMMESLGYAMGDLVQKYYMDEFDQQLKTMYETWDEFPIADPAEEGSPTLADQLYGQLLQLLEIKLSSTYQGMPTLTSDGSS